MPSAWYYSCTRHYYYAKRKTLFQHNIIPTQDIYPYHWGNVDNNNFMNDPYYSITRHCSIIRHYCFTPRAFIILSTRKTLFSHKKWLEHKTLLPLIAWEQVCSGETAAWFDGRGEHPYTLAAVGCYWFYTWQAWRGTTGKSNCGRCWKQQDEWMHRWKKNWWCSAGWQLAMRNNKAVDVGRKICLP